MRPEATAVPKIHSALGDGEPALAAKWLWQPGDIWIAVDESTSSAQWFEGGAVEPKPWMERPITAIPERGRLLYRRASGELQIFDIRTGRRSASTAA